MTQHIVRLGADPEVFLFDPINEKFMSSVGLIGGTKDAPRPIDDEGNAVQEDNVTVEFNIPACATKEAFVLNIKKNLEYIRERAMGYGLTTKIVPSAVFEADQLDSEAARTFGCEPDFNAWKNGEQNPRPTADNPNLRSCGGHVHIQLDHDAVDHLAVVRAMDLFVGCMMLEFDDDKGRRELYGKAGAFRKKNYGVEYRTASNVWVRDDEKIQWVWDQTEKALAFVAQGKTFDARASSMIQDCINNSDLELLNLLKQEFAEVL